tara:strand:- start:23772 stop:24431 length:660 start_codon:yes stop_codon:yes gene_type:complete
MTHAFIPLRSGSKSIKDKNIKKLNGQPLCYWAIKACQESNKIDKVVVAVDSISYEKIISDFNFNKIEIYYRSEVNSQDKSSSESVMLEYINQSQISLDSTFILVQATSPHIQTNEINEMITLKETDNCDIVSCVRLKRFIWNKKGEPYNYNICERPRRQDFSGLLVENGAVYISTVNKILDSGTRISGKIQVYEMSENSFFEIDEEKDFLISELLMKVK